MGMKYCLRVAASSTLLVLSLGGSYGRRLNTSRGIIGEATVDIAGDNDIEDLEQELAWLCSDDPYLAYLHFNANLGTTSYQDCAWVAASPTDRCMLQASTTTSTSGRSSVELNDGSTTGYLLQDACPLSCGLCPTDIVNPETDIDRDGNLSTDDLTWEQIKELEIRLRRRKQNLKRKRKGRKPCPCPDGQHDGGGGGNNNGGGNNGGGGGGGDDFDFITEAPQESSVPRTTPSPTVMLGPDADEPTYYPTFADTSAPTVGGTQQVTSELTSGYTSEYTSEYTSMYTSEYTAMYTSQYTSEYTQDNAAVIGAVISGQQSSSVNNGSATRRLIVILVSAIIFMLLFMALCCFVCVMRRRAGGKGSRGDSDTDESDQVAYPIHKTTSANSDESRFRRVLRHFNGRQDDSRTDVHACTSVMCEVCDNRPRRVKSVDSYKDEYALSKLEEERYKVKEVEC